MCIEFIGVSEIRQYQRKENVIFIDLRDAEDFHKKHIKGAVSMPYEVFLTNYMTLSKNKLYILYCERGATSIRAAAMMQRGGYKARSLAGGMHSAVKSGN